MSAYVGSSKNLKDLQDDIQDSMSDPRRWLAFLVIFALVVHARKCPEEAGDTFKEVRSFAKELQRQVRLQIRSDRETDRRRRHGTVPPAEHCSFGDSEIITPG